MKKTLVLVVFCVACGGASNLTDADEIGQSAGDVMASFEEAGQAGSFAFNTPLKLKPSFWNRAVDWVLPSAEAAGSCWLSAFSACSGGQRVRTFDACTIGRATLSGTIALDFSSSVCSMLAPESSVTRVPNFSVTTRRGSAVVTAAGGGQKVTRTANGFAYQVLGINRKITNAAGTVLVNIDTRTLSDIEVTGTLRQNRVMNGGSLEIKHNVAGYTTVLTPENLTWTAACSCPTSGKLSGTVTGASAKTIAVEFETCGTATVTSGEKSENVELERCGPL